MGHQVPTPLSEMKWRGCQYTLEGVTYGKHATYTGACFDCWLASGGGDD